MKVLYHHRTQAEDGQAVHIRALQQAFVSEGHEVVEVSLVRRLGGGPATREPRQERSGWGAIARLPRFARELAEYAYTPVARAKVLAAARAERPDLVYERYAFGNAGGVLAAKKLGLPLVLEVNSPMVLELQKTRGLTFARSARRLENWIFREATLVCTVTAVLRDMLVESGTPTERVLVTPNGVQPELYRPHDALWRSAARAQFGVAPDALVLGFTGYWRDWHRLDLVIEALCAPALRRAELVLVGEGPARATLEALAARLGVAERVRFQPARPHHEIPRLLPGFDIALVPAINPYASPLKLYEYMASEQAVIAPDQPNLREVLTDGDNALLVAPGDGRALQNALVRLAGDPVLRQQLGRRARATLKDRDLTWRGNARRVVRAVEGLGR